MKRLKQGLAALVAALATTAMVAATSGCGGTRACRDHTVRVTVNYAQASAATQLVIDAAIDGGKTLHGSFAKPGGTSGSAEVDLGSAYVAGAKVTISVQALDGSGTLVASGSQAVTLASGCLGGVTITLTPGGIGGPTMVMITPPSAALKPGGTEKFSANVPVDWSVMESGGGTIDSSGLYTAPSTAGTYTVVAVSQQDATQKATASVTVAAFVVELLAGQLGGSGNADGVGANVRFQSASALAGDGKGILYIGDNSTIRKLDVATGTVTTIVGSPLQSGYVNDTGAKARLTTPGGLTLDGNGKMYMTEVNACAVRMIDLTSLAVTTIAGQYSACGHIDGAGASTARFWALGGLGYDVYHGLWVAERSGNSVRRVSLPDYNVTTLKDSSGAVVSFTNAYDIDVDESFPGAPKVYVDWGGTFDYFTTGQNTPDTMATRTSLGFVSLSNGFALDLPNGNLYMGALGPTGGGFLKQMIISTKAVSTFAGGSLAPADGVGTAAGFFGPRKPYIDGKGNVYVTDVSAIRKIDTSTHAVTTVAGPLAIPGNVDDVGAMARFSRPGAVVYDGTGTLYLDDQIAGGYIRKIDLASGTVSTLVGPKNGNPTPFDDVTALAWDGAGTLYANDLHSGDISYSILDKVDAAGAVTQVIPGTSHLFSAVAADHAGNVFVAEKNAIWKVPAATGVVPAMPIAGVSGTSGKTDTKDGMALFSALQGMVFDGTDTLYVADATAIRKVVLNGDGSTTTSTIAGVADSPGTIDGSGSDARFSAASSISYNGSGLLYVVDGSTVRRVDVASGAVSTWLGVPGVNGVQLGARPAKLNTPRGIACISGDDLVLTDEYAVLRSH